MGQHLGDHLEVQRLRRFGQGLERLGLRSVVHGENLPELLGQAPQAAHAGGQEPARGIGHLGFLGARQPQGRPAQLEQLQATSAGGCWKLGHDDGSPGKCAGKPQGDSPPLCRNTPPAPARQSLWKEKKPGGRHNVLRCAAPLHEAGGVKNPA